jgi:tetratricopeptide (TPR) repeat protein
VLEYDPRNTKVLLRRAVAYSHIVEFDRAHRDLEEAIKLEPDNKEFKRELDQLVAKQKKEQDKQSAVYKKMLFG